ncbi:MAG: plasmid mobilization protein [Steroidobacteraceae bacterium]
MTGVAKLSQLQVRVSEAQKTAIRRAAEQAGMDMSAYVLSRVLPAPARAFQEAVTALNGVAEPSFALAGLNALLSGFTAEELRQAVAAAPQAQLCPFLANYVAAMTETACALRSVPVPAWVQGAPALTEPVFGSALPSLRLHLLTRSPAPFRRRNIFVDSSVGAQV